MSSPTDPTPWTPRATWWWWILGGCVVVRLAIPVAALASGETALPGLPAFRYGPPSGDAYGYYAAARELIAAASRLPVHLAAALLLGVIALGLAVRFKASAALIIGVAAATISVISTLIVVEMQPAGAPVIGWPFAWALGLVPVRVLDPGFGNDAAFAVGFGLSAVAIVATVIATAYVGFWSSGRRLIGLLAAALFALWPFVPGLVVGERAWENGTWYVDVGLHLYTEPLSTALVVSAIALLLRPAASDTTFLLAGLALGFATVVKLSDGVIAVGLVGVLLAFRHLRQATFLSVGGAFSLPLVLAYWDKGYVGTYGGAISASDRPWSLHHVSASWGDSLLFTPLLLVLLVVPAVVGLIVLPSRFARALIGVPIVLTVLTYSAYDFTALHPRFFYVVLPLVLVLDAAAVVAARDRLRGRVQRASPNTI